MSVREHTSNIIASDAIIALCKRLHYTVSLYYVLHESCVKSNPLKVGMYLFASGFCTWVSSHIREFIYV